MGLQEWIEKYVEDGDRGYDDVALEIIRNALNCASAHHMACKYGAGIEMAKVYDDLVQVLSDFSLEKKKPTNRK
jgi:hypothetical protein